MPAGLGDDRDGWLNLLLAECVEPHLGQAAPTILYDYPASQSALAKVCELSVGKKGSGVVFDSPGEESPVELENDARPLPASNSQAFEVAERFELYVCGIELANGYHELLDPAVLRRRNAAANAARVAEGKPALPEDSHLLQAMEAGLPPCSGVALGFDRLVMLAAGAKSLAEVMAFPVDRA